ncbi:MAG TPA: right-handed parallel beta-helix repeat-containing protein, partial [Candidatus Bilamarchaeum sp.]|nr:right-handed parallel beta-helix repeat-containing protein [Candidatus Bilamarchaeum sp.]
LSGANQSSVAGPACVRISVSNVILDCNGFAITNNGTAGLTIAIYTSSVSNVTVMNCPALSQYEYGVYAFGTNNSLFTNITAFNDTDGIFIGSFSSNNTVSNSTSRNNSNEGISVGSANNNTFTGNRVFGNPTGFMLDSNSGNTISGNLAYDGSNGFRLTSSNHTAVSGNIAENNTNNGFYVESSSNNSLDSNNATGNSGDGFFVIVSLFGTTATNTLTNNIASGNGDDGFDLTFSDGNTLSGNTASGNGGRGFELGASSGNFISGNNASGGTSGIFLFSGSVNNTVSGNTITGASGNAIFTGDNNTFIANTVTNNFEGISIGSNNILFLNTVSGTAAFGGFRLESLSSNNILGANTAFNNNRGLEILGANNTTVNLMHLYNNTFVDFLTSGSAGPITISLSDIIFDSPSGALSGYTNLSIQDVVENGTTYSIDHSSDPGSAPTANHVSFADKFVTITNSTPGVSIDSITWNWRDSELTSFNENNFELWKLDGVTWTLQNNSPDTGADTLSMSNLDNFSIFGIFDSATGITDCMDIASPGNYVLSNGLVGANISGSPNFAGNACIRISVSNVLLDCKGFGLTGDSNGTTTGILSEESGGGTVSGVTVQNCAASNYTNGITALGTDSSAFTNNTVFNNSAAGISASGTSLFITSNLAHDNGYQGIYVVNSDTVILTGNTAHDNTNDRGFDVENSLSVALSNNTAYNNFYGLILTGGDDTVSAAGNEFHSNFYGVTVPGGNTNIQLSGNQIHDNTRHGFDVFGTSGVSLSGDHFYNNALSDPSQYFDFHALNFSGGTPGITLSGVIFDSPSGTFTNYTNLSAGDTANDSYGISWSAVPAPPAGFLSFAGKAVSIANLTESVSIDSAAWNWLDSELTNTTNESRFSLWEYNGTWALLNATLDTGANTLSLSNIASFSVFAILENNSSAQAPSGGDSDGGGANPPLSLSLSGNCSDNVVTVTDGGPVAGAEVKVDGVSIGFTDSSGQASFTGCGKSVTVRASRSGYSDAVENIWLSSCQCAQCASSADCTDGEQCSAGQCVAVQCSCGQVSAHQCVAYACCADSDCGAGQECSGHACVPVEQPQCTSDSGCADTERCDAGICREITGCGVVSGHKLSPYECGDGPDCPVCPSPRLCEANSCILYDLQCPSSGQVGASVSCKLLRNGEACQDCAGSLTDPDGQPRPFSTGADGTFTFSLDKEGQYKVSLLKNGASIRSLAVTSVPKTSVPGSGKPTAQGGPDLAVPLLILLLVVIIGGILYWRSRNSKK